MILRDSHLAASTPHCWVRNLDLTGQVEIRAGARARSRAPVSRTSRSGRSRLGCRCVHIGRRGHAVRYSARGEDTRRHFGNLAGCTGGDEAGGNGLCSGRVWAPSRCGFLGHWRASTTAAGARGRRWYGQLSACDFVCATGAGELVPEAARHSILGACQG